MLHVLSLVAVLLLPALVTSFPRGDVWKAMYERRSQASYPGPRNPIEVKPGYVCCNQPPTPPGGTRPKAPRRRRPRPLQPLDVTRRDNADDRSGPLRRALQELSILQQHQRNSVAAAQEARILPQADVPALLPPGGGSLGGLYARKREELLARLLGGRPAMLSGGAVQDLRSPVVVPVSASEEGDLLLEDAHKRGGFIVRRNGDAKGAPGSPGGPNMFGR